MSNHNTAWMAYELRGDGQTFYVNKELATKRALSHLMCVLDDFDRDNFEWKDIGDDMGYWTHTTGRMRWVESLRIYTGD